MRLPDKSIKRDDFVMAGSFAVSFEQSLGVRRNDRLLVIFARKNLHPVERFEAQQCNEFHFIVLGLANEKLRAFVARNAALRDFEQNFFPQKIFLLLRLLSAGAAPPQSTH